MRRLRRIVVMLSALALAGCGGDDSAPVASETLATAAETESTQSPSLRAELPPASSAPEALRPGRVTTSAEFPGPAVAFTVPDDWYGAEGETGFAIGDGLDEAAQEFASGGIFVDLLGLPLAEATARFEAIDGVEVESVREIQFGGHPAKRYDVAVSGQVLLDALGAAVDLRTGSPGPIFVNVRGRTLLIRWEFTSGRDEIEKVLRSFEFPR